MRAFRFPSLWYPRSNAPWHVPFESCIDSGRSQCRTLHGGADYSNSDYRGHRHHRASRATVGYTQLSEVLAPENHIAHGAANDVTYIPRFKGRGDEVERSVVNRVEMQTHVDNAGDDNHVDREANLAGQSYDIYPPAILKSRVREDQVRRVFTSQHKRCFAARGSVARGDSLFLKHKGQRIHWRLVRVHK